ncbi:MAG: LacI family DNA-binding transcriptional regulator [Lachnospiraceae bacterium]|nr:LacI family DNA-binding transcriptional regulator [Lachnospiraceae bacterium]
MAKGVRMSDIAQRLGVSTVTVSKALAGQKGVSEEMRERIKALAEELGYKAPASAREDTKRSYNIGVIMGEVYTEKYATFYWEFYQKINTCAVQENCYVILEVLDSVREKELGEPKIVQENKIDGLIILGGIQTKYLQMLKKKCRVPVVYMDFYDKQLQEDCVISNSFYGAYHMTNYLFRMGHKEIGFVGTVLSTESIMDRYLGYLKSLMEHGVQLREDWVLNDRGESSIYCYDTIPLPRELPSAFVCNSDLTASKMVKTLQEAGYRVPEDISIVGYDDWLYPGLCDVAITTYSVDMSKMAKTGIEILVRRIGGEESRRDMQIIEGDIVVRESVKRLNG